MNDRIWLLDIIAILHKYGSGMLVSKITKYNISFCWHCPFKRITIIKYAFRFCLVLYVVVIRTHRHINTWTVHVSTYKAVVIKRLYFSYVLLYIFGNLLGFYLISHSSNGFYFIVYLSFNVPMFITKPYYVVLVY